MAPDWRAKLKGVTDSRYPGKVTHFRGITYATIEHRFARPILNEQWAQKKTEFTKFGPRCPQPPVDLHAFMHIPSNLPTHDTEDEDELRCANLNITCPSDLRIANLPVLLWIYGGSQVNTFGSATQKMSDPGPLVAQSIELDRPIMLVTVNYRLNLFAFAERDGEINLDLQDLRTAIEWVRKNIHDFGGNPDNITLGGISAGAVYTHALLASGSSGLIKRAILTSGCLYSTPPQSEKRCLGLLGIVEGNLALMEMEKGNMNPTEAAASTLAGASVDNIVQTLKDLQVSSMWMCKESSLKNWDDDGQVFKSLEGVLISDCHFEASEDEASMSKLSASKIADAFKAGSTTSAMKISQAYGINDNNNETCRRAALDFITDSYYAYPAHRISRNINAAGGKAYQVYFEQGNPFMTSDAAHAHHGVDLFAIFGGYDGFISEEMKAVGRELREKWINFVSGLPPWKSENVLVCGPDGLVTEKGRKEAARERRVEQFAVLEEAGLETYQEIWLKLQAAANVA